ncbi:hypothetical protein ABE29_21650 [Cytobacillus firmus]|uniref:hypothetical protein n=1 Tax=Cytobacillus firmus TaxID=1399 RepID=UPI00077C8EED|nr:hypothetical protein [Cytobacillus firmus]MBG9541405.1 hypothetical protein [Cytobacillus firmus]MBG9541409.1 hypothetical protein [Cytobacillus firmus]MBG9541422.1 hypothetical protein [Cytobacillus firmus]MBG9541571.1 hypothetical protein [Cytobacillus firmus]MBG9545034.1 hypothetical protein [Cytobacillus firmus]
MIPTEVENRVAKYFFHRYLPEEVMMKIEDRLLTTCIWDEEGDLDFDELVRWAIEIIDEQLEDKRFR